MTQNNYNDNDHNLNRMIKLNDIIQSCQTCYFQLQFQIFDFELLPNDIERLRELDRREDGRTWHAFEGYLLTL